MQQRHGLVITSAHFRKSPSAPWVRVFWDARIGEIYVPYHTGFAFFDVSDFTFGWVPINSNDCPAAKGGTPLGPGPDVCKEVHDRGLAWKDDTMCDAVKKWFCGVSLTLRTTTTLWNDFATMA